MAKIRIFDLAKELKLQSKDLIKILIDLGIAAKSHMSSIEEESAALVKDLVLVEKKPPEKLSPSVKKEKVEKEIKPKEILKEKPVPVKETPKETEVKTEKKEILISGKTITVKDLSAILNIPLGEIIKLLMSKGTLATINQEISFEAAKEVALYFGLTVKEAPLPEETKLTAVIIEENQEKMVSRPAVVTILGHVDHGKTRLLDTIRKTNVMEKEAGGITQHIGAYQVKIGDKLVTFLDTPGHEAFTSLRARGAKVTDIAVLIVAADDGVMPQTKEALDHARAANVPIIVAINKIDKPEANIDRTKKQLADLGLVPEEWGGQTVMVQISAKQGTGIDELLEMILLTAEVQELKANKEKLARGYCIEAKLDRERGSTATLLIREGTLYVGDICLVGTVFGKIRAMTNDKGQKISKAGPSSPVEILGLSAVPTAGDTFEAVKNIEIAREIASMRFLEIQQGKSFASRVSLEYISRGIREGEIKNLNLIIKADVHGSLEAITSSLRELKVENIGTNIIHAATGTISESDVMLAKASLAIILGFNVDVNSNARKLADDETVDVRQYQIIYEVINDVKNALAGLLEPEFEEIITGKAQVRQIFTFSKIGTIAGCFITEGKISRTDKIRVFRQSKKIYEGRITSLRRFKDDVKEVAAGFECGIVLENLQEITPNDTVETFQMKAKVLEIK